VNRSGALNNPPKPADAQRSGASAGYPPGYSEPSIIFFRVFGLSRFIRVCILGVLAVHRVYEVAGCHGLQAVLLRNRWHGLKTVAPGAIQESEIFHFRRFAISGFRDFLA